MFRINIIVLVFLSVCSPLLAGDSAPQLDGSALSIFWVLPFVGILLSIAVFPLVAPKFWHRHYGKVSLFWSLTLLLALVAHRDIGILVAFSEILHVALLEYIPFILLLLALFTISGGIFLTGTMVGTPLVNSGLILLGTLLASWMGTTGSAMLLIRPLIRANKGRQHKVHTFVFFIFLAANIGGSLTPLGDPPLFLGFLKGVDFFWTTTAMLGPMTFMVVSLMIIYFFLDSYYYKRENHNISAVSADPEKLGVRGGLNFLFLAGVLGAVLISGMWKPGIDYHIGHTVLHIQNILRDLLLIILTMLSVKLTEKEIREANEFTWFPIIEVGKLFAGIFITIIPAIAILKAGTDGAFAGVIRSVSDNGEPVNLMYFWLTGILSSFLDNAPTYLVFFNTAGGDPVQLMGQFRNTLMAISAGAVFMGANTYIGNAPNFMVKSIAEAGGIRMPTFFGYLFRYAVPILFPLYLVWSVIFL